MAPADVTAGASSTEANMEVKGILGVLALVVALAVLAVMVTFPSSLVCAGIFLLGCGTLTLRAPMAAMGIGLVLAYADGPAHAGLLFGVILFLGGAVFTAVTLNTPMRRTSKRD